SQEWLAPLQAGGFLPAAGGLASPDHSSNLAFEVGGDAGAKIRRATRSPSRTSVRSGGGNAWRRCRPVVPSQPLEDSPLLTILRTSLLKLAVTRVIFISDLLTVSPCRYAMCGGGFR